MAIKYLDAKRIRGLSSDTKPTNVPENTLFEETDTRKVFFLQDSAWVNAVRSADWEDTAFDDDWTTASGDDASVSGGKILVSPNGGSTDSMTFDLEHSTALNGTSVDSSEWVFQFTIDQTAFEDNSTCDYRDGYVAISDVVGTTQSGDHVIFYINNTDCSFQASGYRFAVKNGANIDGAHYSSTATEHFKPDSNAMIAISTTQGLNSDGKLGIRISRTASDAFRLEICTDPTFAAGTTTTYNTSSTSICGNCTSLRYIRVGGFKQGSATGSNQFTIDNMKFWNGQSEV